MATLALALQGPLATYGIGTHERHKATHPYPTKSAVCGLIAACLGREYGADMQDLFALRVHVRDDLPGTVMQDFQTVAKTTRANGTVNPDTFIVYREFLQDSAALAVIEGPAGLLGEIEAALLNPKFLPYLGTRTCLPSRPVWVEGVSEDAPLVVMQRVPALSGGPGMRAAYLEDRAGPLTLQDQPMQRRGFTRRRVLPTSVTLA